MNRAIHFVIFGLVAGIAPAARAADVAPGERQYSRDPAVLPGWSTSAAPVDGEVLGTLTTPFDVRDPEIPDVLFSRGTFTARVVREAGRDGLTFDYRLVESASGGPPEIGPIEVGGFRTYATDVRSRVLAEEEAYLGIVRSADGDLLRFEYDSPGLDEYLIVRTNAPAFAEGGLMRVGYEMSGGDGFGTIPLPTFRPVPEPAACALLAASVLFLARRRRRPCDRFSGDAR
jgi:hypothetical protein